MARPNPNIALSVETPDFAQPLLRLNEQRRQKKIDDSNLATAEQNRKLTGLQIEAAERKLNAPSEDAHRASLNAAVLDTIAMSDLVKQANNRSALDPQGSAEMLQQAGALGIGVRDKFVGLGMDTERLERTLNLIATDPRGASQFLQQQVLPAIQPLLEDFFVQGDGAQQNLRTGRVVSDPSATGNMNSESVPMAVKEFEFFQALETPEERRTFLNLKRANPSEDLGDRIIITDPTDPSGPPLAELDKDLAPADEPGNIAAQEEAQQTARLQTQRVFEAGGAKGTLDVVQAQSDTMLEAIDSILEHPGLERATGIGKFDPTAFLPTEHGDVRLLVNQLKDRIFVESLQNIRASSPTGGAVGQVSDREGGRLENMLGSLDRGLRDDEFVRQLKGIRDQVETMKKLSQEAFEGAYGDINSSGDLELDMILQQIGAQEEP